MANIRIEQIQEGFVTQVLFHGTNSNWVRIQQRARIKILSFIFCMSFLNIMSFTSITLTLNRAGCLGICSIKENEILNKNYAYSFEKPNAVPQKGTTLCIQYII
jgi:hypothetical protein